MPLPSIESNNNSFNKKSKKSKMPHPGGIKPVYASIPYKQLPTKKKVEFVVLVILTPLLVGLFVGLLILGINMKDYYPELGGYYVWSTGGVILTCISAIFMVVSPIPCIWGAWSIKHYFTGKYKPKSWASAIADDMLSGLEATEIN